jgi:hypothetical protein
MLIEGKFAYSIHVILPAGAREPVRILRSGFIQGSLDALLGILTTYILHNPNLQIRIRGKNAPQTKEKNCRVFIT